MVGPEIYSCPVQHTRIKLPEPTRGDELFDHCPGGTGGLAIPDRLLDGAAAVPLPMEPGCVLLMQ